MRIDGGGRGDGDSSRGLEVCQGGQRAGYYASCECSDDDECCCWDAGAGLASGCSWV